MSIIEDISLHPLTEPQFVKTQLMRYRQNGTPKMWEIAHVHDSVAVLLYHKQKEAFILVKQFRPAVFLRNEEGFTHELCAGICDKESSLEQIAVEEIMEECGYEVKPEALEKISGFYTSVGFAGSKQALFYAEVDEQMRKGEGGGIEHEEIEVIEVAVDDAYDFALNESYAKTPGLMFAFLWWFKNKS